MKLPAFLRSKLLILVALLGVFSRAHSAPGDVDLSFDPGSGVNGTVNAAVVQPDGKVLIGGEFTTVSGLVRHRVARLNADGTGDSSFAAAEFLTNPVLSLVLQRNGKVLVGHEGSNYGLTRLNADGTLDTAFNNNSEAAIASTEPFNSVRVTALLEQPDGKVLYGGESLLRLNADGTLDNTFRSGAIGWVYCIARQPDGKLLVGGYFHDAATNVSSYGLARLNSDGSLDSTFDRAAGQDRLFFSIAVQADGKVLAGGASGLPHNSCLIRMNSNGTLDSSFAPSISTGQAKAVVLQVDGKILVGGGFSSINGNARQNLARLNTDGSVDLSFTGGVGGTGDTSVRAVALAGQGGVIVAGAFTTANGIGRNRVARFHPDGSLDVSFDPGVGLRSPISSVVMQTDGNVLIAGGINAVHGPNMVALARLTANGSRDSSFVADFGTTDVLSVSLQTDQKILVGVATFPGGSAVGRLQPDGTGDNSFRPDLEPLVQYDAIPDGYSGEHGIVVTATLTQPDGKVLVAGYTLLAFWGGGGEAGVAGSGVRSFLTRFHPDGTADGGFTPVIGNQVPFATYWFGWTQYPTSALTVQADGKIYYAGTFNSVNGTSRKALARLHPNGAVDTTFNLDVFFASALAIQSDGKLLVGGILPPVYNRGVFRLNADGSLDTGFNTRISDNHAVESLALQPDGRIVIGGSFETVNGTTRNRVARLNANGTLDGTFNSGAGPNGPVVALALQADGHVLIAGGFTGVSGIARPSVARLLGNGNVPPPVAEIAVEQPAGTNLVDGTASVGFGNVTLGQSRELAFRIRNTGGADLTGVSVAISGADASAFAVTLAPAASIPGPAGGSTFAVRFTPGTQGAKTALLQVTSNDADESSFDITLTGFGASRAPVAVADSVTAPFQTAVEIDVLANDTDPDGDALTIVSATNGGRGHATVITTPSGQRIRYNPTLSTSGPDSFTYTISDGLGGEAMSAVSVTIGPPPADQEIVIERQGGGNMEDDISVIDFGAIAASMASEHTFTIRNSGDFDLTGLTVTISGTHASAYSLLAQPSASIAPQGSSTFTVRFGPASRGTKTALLQVFSNDGDESPFDISLTGAGANASPVAVADTATTAYQTAVDVNVVANDSDPEGDVLTIAGATNGAHGTAQVIATSGGQRIRYTPASGYSGADSFTYSISDGFGGHAIGTVSINVKEPKGKRVVTRYSKGGAVSGAGNPSSGVPAGATWKSFGVPSIADNGSVAFLGTLAAPGASFVVVYIRNDGAQEAGAAEYLVAKQGDAAPGVSGTTFGSFKDPLLNDNGTVVFLGTLRGGSETATTGIWKHYPRVGSGVSSLVARTGAEAAGVPGARWKTFTSVAASDGAAGEESIAFAARMAAGPGGVRASNDDGLWIAHAGGVTLALREGAAVMVGATSTAVKSFTALQPLAGAAGQGRGATAAGVLARVKFDDGTEAVLRVSVAQGGVQVSTIARAGDALPGAGVNLAGFGLPAQSSDGHAAFVATLSGSARENDTAVVQTTGSAHELIAREGDQPIAGDATAFRAFGAVANDSAGRVAFTAQLSGGGVNAPNVTAIFLRDHNALTMIARQGAQPPGVPAGAKWASFPSFALPEDTAGPIFVGTLVIPAAGTSSPARIAANSTGIWAMDSTGELQLIARTGDVFDGQRKITALTLLSTVRSSPSQLRSFTRNGEVIYRATLSDGSQHVVAAQLP